MEFYSQLFSLVARDLADIAVFAAMEAAVYFALLRYFEKHLNTGRRA